MDAFEEHLQVFGSTTHGSEMREELYSCFYLIKVEIEQYASKIDEARDKINELYGGG